jgi:hypothetical protein
VSSTDEPTASRKQGTPLDSSQEDNPNLAKLLEDLEGVLRPVAKSARLMDDSAEDAHKIAEDIYSFVSEKVFIADQLDPARYGDLYRLFEMTHEEEDDTYFVYEGALERYQERRKKTLTVTEDTTDSEALAGWRRKYIHKLREFKDQAVTIKGRMSGRIAPSKQEPEPG